ncbi:MAG: DUF1501 domain-containing protein [Planctomycetota bacterium]|nr:MAG: DUF1501 domain-containing protein [Planctomycetota bacterium]REJ91579.1 MAG: DUF1501 domain-containing protein [Planctomycetota bacterium]
MANSPRISRRAALEQCGLGLGMLGLTGVLAQDGVLAAESRELNPLAVRPPHFAPKAKHVIHIFLNGGLSHIDTFDHKPLLAKYHGKPIPGVEDEREDNVGPGLASPFKFRQYGSHGLYISDMFRRTGEMIDEVCVVNSLYTDAIEHRMARTLMHCGSATQETTPSIGSWLTYGLGTENQNLPGYVVLCPCDGQQPEFGSVGWRSGFLPPIYQGTYIDTIDTDDVRKLIRHIDNPYIRRGEQQRQFELLQRLNREHLADRPGDAELEARIASYEMAFRMQTEATDAFDLLQEPQAVRDMYGPHKPAQQLLLARRLIERGVRFVQAWTYPGQPFDNHEELKNSLSSVAMQIDQGFTALVKDLKRVGLFDETLIVMCGEFGRLPTSQMLEGGKIGEGRNHNAHAFNVILAGGGVKAGVVHGATDDFGHRAVEDRMHVHDLQATILHLMGLDHKRLTYRHAGRDFRLTDVHGKVVPQILA